MELRIRVDDMVAELKQAGLFLIPGGDLCLWLVDEATLPAEPKPPPHAAPFVALQHVAAGRCSAELQTFFAEVLNFVQAQAGVGEPAEPPPKSRAAY